ILGHDNSRVTGSINWHWLNKHPVEFSNNQHTPLKLAQLSLPHPGQLLYFTRSLAVVKSVFSGYSTSSGFPSITRTPFPVILFREIQ
ncbi:hypothetical protein AB0J72_38770, partial [Dactylosporangium sp. NPDC049742]|uniref:hypothetical protein n=1 Tax=Dactylosporangium sp. NPDC049742 TaxID=3154737 RepID=UPI00342898C0